MIAPGTRTAQCSRITNNTEETTVSFAEIEYRVTNRVAVVTLNRPDQLNAWTAVMGQEVRRAMEQARDDDNVRVIVLTGAGRGFCAGADMKLLSSISTTGRIAETADAPMDVNSRPDFQRKNTYFPAVPKPIIAAINGPCAGLGMCFALFCDMRFAGQDEGLFRRAEAAVEFDDGTMMKRGLDATGRHFIYQPESAGEKGPLPVYLKSGENRYVEFGARKFYPPFVPKAGP